jgi:hypothetical protein
MTEKISTMIEEFNQHTTADYNLINEINLLDPDLVIDINCGSNKFRNHIKNLIGIDQDPNSFANLYTTIEKIIFRKESIDVIIWHNCNKISVQEQLMTVVSWLKPGGYIIMQPVDYDQTNAWTETDAKIVGDKHALSIVNGTWKEIILNNELNNQSNRLSWWYQKFGVRKRYSINVKNCNIFERTE